MLVDWFTAGRFVVRPSFSFARFANSMTALISLLAVFSWDTARLISLGESTLTMAWLWLSKSEKPIPSKGAALYSVSTFLVWMV